MSIETSAALRRTVDAIGPPARRWLAELEETVARTAREWALDVGGPLRHDGVASVVVPATTDDGVDAVLKLSVPHDEARGEAEGLRLWDGEGAVRLLRASPDRLVLLLERCRPGTDLWTRPTGEQVEVLADLLPGLWVEPPADGDLPDLATTVEAWGPRLPEAATRAGLHADVGLQARHRADELVRDMPRRLLHGDLHPGNVLAAERRPWLAIDPKPWIGDPAFDLAQTIANWARPDRQPDGRVPAPAAVRGLADDLARRLDLDPRRVASWALVKALGWRSSGDVVRVLAEAFDEESTT